MITLNPTDFSTGQDQGLADLPLSRHVLFHSHDLANVRSEVAKVYCDHQLEIKNGVELDARHHHASLANISLNYMEYGAEVQITPGELHDFFLIQLPLSGSARIQSGKQEVISTSMVASIPAPDQYLTMRWSADCHQLLIQINRDTLEQQLSYLLGRPIQKPLVFDLLMNGERDDIASWWRFIWYVIHEFEYNVSLAISNTAVSHMERAIMAHLLYAQPHNYTDALNAQTRSIAPVHVKRAEEYMQEHVTMPISINDLVKITSVSARSLYDGFRRFRSTTPMNYLRSLRLKNVHKDLLECSENTRVTEIATKWSFTQFGRFSVAYKKVYGQSPSDTIRQRWPSKNH